jgi:hypothetical protein
MRMRMKMNPDRGGDAEKRKRRTSRRNGAHGVFQPTGLGSGPG